MRKANADISTAARKALDFQSVLAENQVQVSSWTPQCNDCDEAKECLHQVLWFWSCTPVQHAGTNSAFESTFGTRSEAPKASVPPFLRKFSDS